MPSQLPTPEEARSTFHRLFEADPEKAADYLYNLGLSSGYIKAEAITENICWISDSTYGTLECTINVSKPEKDPRAIAAAATPQPQGGSASESPTSHEPLCDLCWENESFAGTPTHPAKPGLRIAAITLGGQRWGLQYSPYAYFPKHCIALCQEHRPMKIDGPSIERLLDFVDAFPFYFIGANADLPIVGGSILSHDHFQGGRHLFPLMQAPIEHEIHLDDTPEVRCGIVRWPASVLRLVSDDRAALTRTATHILEIWRTYSDEARDIIASSTPDAQSAPIATDLASRHIPHNTLNPIVRKEGYTYTLDLVLRNNRTDPHHPWGIFHPDESLHHIKKENIGLIEIMGLAILPPRLAVELPFVQRELIDAAQEGRSAQEVETRLQGQPATAAHAMWAADVFTRRASEFLDPCELYLNPHGSPRDLHPVLQQEVARVFESVLECTGVFKRTKTGQAGWDAFIETIKHPDTQISATKSERQCKQQGKRNDTGDCAPEQGFRFNSHNDNEGCCE